jgi:hypothetical protein
LISKDGFWILNNLIVFYTNFEILFSVKCFFSKLQKKGIPFSLHLPFWLGPFSSLKILSSISTMSISCRISSELLLINILCSFSNFSCRNFSVVPLRYHFILCSCTLCRQTVTEFQKKMDCTFFNNILSMVQFRFCHFTGYIIFYNFIDAISKFNPPLVDCGFCIIFC